MVCAYYSVDASAFVFSYCRGAYLQDFSNLNTYIPGVKEAYRLPHDMVIFIYKLCTTSIHIEALSFPLSNYISIDVILVEPREPRTKRI